MTKSDLLSIANDRKEELKKVQAENKSLERKRKSLEKENKKLLELLSNTQSDLELELKGSKALREALKSRDQVIAFHQQEREDFRGILEVLQERSWAARRLLRLIRKEKQPTLSPGILLDKANCLLPLEDIR